MTYTPGPWTAVRDDCHFGSLSTVTAGNMVVQVGGLKSSVEEMEANTRLIAAAPELLAALKQIVGAEGLFAEPASGQHAREIARAAIARVEGRDT